MAGKNNPGQFGNMDDTQQQVSSGGQAIDGSFQEGSQRASETGRKGAENQSREAKQRGGEHSSQS